MAAGALRPVSADGGEHAISRPGRANSTWSRRKARTASHSVTGASGSGLTARSWCIRARQPQAW